MNASVTKIHPALAVAARFTGGLPAGLRQQLQRRLAAAEVLGFSSAKIRRLELGEAPARETEPRLGDAPDPVLTVAGDGIGPSYRSAGRGPSASALLNRLARCAEHRTRTSRTAWP